jgi:hypothetical protein
MPDGTATLKLDGEILHPHWVAFLFSGLGACHVSVVAGQAKQRSIVSWEATFRVDLSRCPTPAKSLNILGMMNQEQLPLNVEIPHLTSYQIVRRPDESLEVRVQGPDQIGFLGRLLAKLCMLGLFPVEMTIDTVAGQVQDSLVFRGIAGVAPNEATRQRLDSLLQSAVKLA